MEKSRTSIAERRRYKRLAPLLKREEQVLIEKDTHWMSTTIVNLGPAGALLTFTDSDALFTAGETLNLFFDNGGQPIVIKAIVLRSDSKEIAFEFSDLSPDTRTAIETKLIRMAIISERIMAIDGHEIPTEPESLEKDAGSLVGQECS